MSKHRPVLFEFPTSDIDITLHDAQTLFKDETSDESLVSNELRGGVKEERQGVCLGGRLEVCNALQLGVVTVSLVQLLSET